MAWRASQELTSGVVRVDEFVDHEMELALGVGARDAAQEAQELFRAVAWLAVGQYLAAGDLKRGLEGGGAIAAIVVGTAFGQPWPQGEDRLGTVKRLDLVLFVDAQDERAGRRSWRMTGFPPLAGALSRPLRGRFCLFQVICPKISAQAKAVRQQTLRLWGADSVYRGNTRCRFAGTSRDGSDGTRTRDLRRDRPVMALPG
jgi:hypothetical protein